MAFFRVALLVCSLMLVLGTSIGWTDDGLAAYQEARGNYTGLQKSAKRKLYRENWEKVISGLLDVAETYAGHRKAPNALYMAAKACSELYSISRSKEDARRAVKLFERTENSYPTSSLADDSLVLAAGLLESPLASPGRAYLLYSRVVDDYPAGDMRSLALAKQQKLAVYAPAAPAKKQPVKARSPVRPAASGKATLESVRFWTNPGYTRVVLNLTGGADYTGNLLAGDAAKGREPRIYVDVKGASFGPSVAGNTKVNDGLLRQIRTGQPTPDTLRVVLDLTSFSDYKIFTLQDPERIVIDVAGDKSPGLSGQQAELRTLPRADKDSITRILDAAPKDRPLKVRIPSNKTHGGLRRIVVDAGHGGKDPGAIGPSGIMEKDVTLRLARELKRRLEAELGCEVILTRDGDVFLPLEERTAIANKVGADLFISVHANANRSRDAYGIETFYLNFSKNDKAAAVAARENGTSLKEVGDLELILFDLMANAKINESSRLATEIQNSLVEGLGRHYSQIRDLGVRQGPFYVLVGATMPSVLVEVAFISNHREEKRLKDRTYHQKAGEAIVKGVRNYAKALKLIAAQ